MGRYGVIPSPKDERDFRLERLIPKAEKFPDEFQIEGTPINIYDQGNVGQCVAFSLREIREVLEKKYNNKTITFSNNFIYGARDDDMYQGEGMIPREALKILQKKGVCHYELFPGIDYYAYCKAAISQPMLDDAQPFKIGAYAQLYTVDEIKTALMHIGPVLYCIPVYDYFENSGAVIKNRPELNTDIHLLGYHALMCIGWRKDGTWIIQNSWGRSWGDNGLCYLDYNYPFVEAWSVSFVPPSPPPSSTQYEVYFEDKTQAEKISRLLGGKVVNR